jgi:hypothetical protein
VALTSPRYDAATIVAAFAHAVAAIIARRPDAARDASPSAMLTVSQTAALLGTSPATVIRKADAGDLPCIVISRGARQNMRRFPRTMIEDLAAHGGCGNEVDLRDCTAGWLEHVANHAIR